LPSSLQFLFSSNSSCSGELCGGGGGGSNCFRQQRRDIVVSIYVEV